ncbi:hypothetical protein [Parasphingorhabdus sp.]|uniref:hypothetical protein n=1 Tax=Parasphingorhabdus sp. TaxID=2709688 RepID=UPI003D27F2FA
MLSAAKSAFAATRPGERFYVMDIADGQSVISMEIENRKRFESQKLKLRAYASELGKLQIYLSEVSGQDIVSKSALASDIPSVLRAVGDLRDKDSPPARLLILGSGLHITANSSTSMYVDGQSLVPSDTLLTGSLLTSPYGIGDRQDYLTGVNVTFCAILPDKLTAHEHQEVAHMWGHYIALRGGNLVNFTSDIKLCIRKFKGGEGEPLQLRALDPEIAPAMIAADESGKVGRITISGGEVYHDKLAAVTAERDQERQARKSAEQKAAKAREGFEVALRNARKADELLGSADDLDGVTVFSRFQSIAHPSLRHVNVMTGVQFSRANYPKYDKSWCYFNHRKPNGTIVQFDVGDRRYGGKISYDPPQEDALREVGMHERDFMAARQACRFPN